MLLPRPLVTTDWLFARRHDPNLVLADVRWSLGEPGAGWRDYQAAHIPGAVFVDVDDELANRSDPRRGRHPLPDPERLVLLLAARGIGRDSSVVVYDGGAGDTAVRLWWLLRWVGARDVALLDGGFAKWAAEGKPVEAGIVRPRPAERPLPPAFDRTRIVHRTEVEPAVRRGALLLDARSAERFRGENEPIDWKAGHIPGATSAPWAGNMTDSEPKTFRSPAELRARFEALGATPDREIIAYCGSGVTACHNVLALELAGFPHTRLYPGSWSEWIEHN